MAWDACHKGANGTRFDNGDSLWPAQARGGIGAFQVTGTARLRGAGGCDLTWSYNISDSISAPFDASSGIRYETGWSYLEVAA